MTQTMPAKSFYFLRHGETDWNKQHLYMGSSDIPLNKTGIQQATKAGQCLKNEPISIILTSPLSRAFQTAHIIASIIQKPVVPIDGLQECGWGVKEGQAVDKTDGELVAMWLSNQHFEQAESGLAFVDRVAKAMMEVWVYDDPVLIVAHGGTYCAIQRLFGWPLMPSLENCRPIFHQVPKYTETDWSFFNITKSNKKKRIQTM